MSNATYLFDNTSVKAYLQMVSIVFENVNKNMAKNGMLWLIAGLIVINAFWGSFRRSH